MTLVDVAWQDHGMAHKHMSHSVTLSDTVSDSDKCDRVPGGIASSGTWFNVGVTGLFLRSLHCRLRTGSPLCTHPLSSPPHAVHLDQQRQQGRLTLHGPIVATGRRTGTADGIDLVNEDDARRLRAKKQGTQFVGGLRPTL